MVRLAVRVPSASAEAVLAALLDLAPAGVEQVDGHGWVEYAVYGAPGELPTLPEGDAEVAGVAVSVRGEEAPEDWAERWKRFHSSVRVGERLHLRPPWEEPTPGAGVEDLVIDPGQAFGTGAHPTTRLSLELLLGLDPSGSFADLGCGSGVLAIAAAKLGFAPITAVDCDRAAVRATLEGAERNGVDLDRVGLANLRAEAPPAADVVAANLMRPLLLQVARRMEVSPRALIVSGLLDHEADEVSRAFTGLSERRRLSDGGWSAVLLEPEPPPGAAG